MALETAVREGGVWHVDKGRRCVNAPAAEWFEGDDVVRFDTDWDRDVVEEFLLEGRDRLCPDCFPADDR